MVLYADAPQFKPGRLLSKADKEEIALTSKEKQFLKLACSDLTYKQVAAEINVSERTVDGYRETHFQKFLSNHILKYFFDFGNNSLKIEKL